MKEVQAKPFYLHKSYVNTYYVIYEALETWIANHIFREDTSRVFLASNSYAFRRRFELTDTSKDYSKIEASSLNFPFANYAPQQVGWVADPRIASNTAAMAYIGMYEGSTRLRASAVVLSIPITFYFDSEVDARIAYEILWFKTFNEHYYSAVTSYGEETLELPVNIMIKNLSFNPRFTETDWLKQNRIFVITAQFDVRSYIIQPPSQPKYGREYTESDEYDDGVPKYALVEDVILNIGNTSLKFKSYPSKEDFPKVGEEGIVYVDTKTPSQTYEGESYTKDAYPTVHPITYVWDSAKKLYKLNNECKFTSLREDGTIKGEPLVIDECSVSTRYTNAILKISSTVSEGTTVDKVEMLLSGFTKAFSIEYSSEIEYPIKGLTENSTYVGYIVFYFSDGKTKKIEISFTTKSKEDKPKVTKVGLIGHEF